MASFQKFNTFALACMQKKHNLSASADVLKIMLTLVAPVATNAVKADLTEIAAGFGYSAGGTAASVTSLTQSSGTAKLVIGDVVFTASGGPIADCRYLVLYNDTAANDELIGFWDKGSTISAADGETITGDADPTTGILTVL